jgi:hypothetical protein
MPPEPGGPGNFGDIGTLHARARLWRLDLDDAVERQQRDLAGLLHAAGHPVPLPGLRSLERYLTDPVIATWLALVDTALVSWCASRSSSDLGCAPLDVGDQRCRIGPVSVVLVPAFPSPDGVEAGGQLEPLHEVDRPPARVPVREDRLDLFAGLDGPFRPTLPLGQNAAITPGQCWTDGGKVRASRSAHDCCPDVGEKPAG